MTALLASMGCADPDYRPSNGGGADASRLTCAEASNCPVPDAGDADARAGSDATTDVPDARMSTPEPEASLPGLYALRIRFYGADTAGFFKYAQEIVALGEITRDPQDDAMQLVLSWCEDHAVTAAPPPAANTEARMVQPSAYPDRKYTLLVSGDEFETIGEPVHAGWAAMEATSCPAGSKKPSNAAWSSGTCTCPSDGATPTSPDDCRVVDSDGDGKPGFTVRWSGGLAADNYAARTDLSQLRFGAIDVARKKHRAQYFWNHDHRSLTCAGSCPSAPSYRKCVDSSVDVASFEPITDRATWTCESVKRRIEAGELFTSEPLVPRPDC